MTCNTKFKKLNSPIMKALIIVLGLTLGAFQPAMAAPKKPKTDIIKLNYDIYGHGFKLMSLKVDLLLNGKNYTMKTRLKTVGVATFFASIRARYHAKGTLSKTRVRPKEFWMYIEKAKGRKSASVSWNKNGIYQAKQKPGLNKRKKADVKRALRSRQPDPLSAFLALMFTTHRRPCKLKQRIFDGRKIFELAFSYVKQVKLPQKNRGVYQGKVYRCALKDRPIAGYSFKKMAKSKTKGRKPLNIWLAPLKKRIIGRNFLMPVLIKGSTRLMDVTVSLTSAKINGRPLAQLSLARK